MIIGQNDNSFKLSFNVISWDGLLFKTNLILAFPAVKILLPSPTLYRCIIVPKSEKCALNDFCSRCEISSAQVLKALYKVKLLLLRK